ncbi:alpha/beta fold hydrolase [Flagellimonas zhangzhouensis]|uniref:Pimeloyl-ACP methyl ester carboxylesterase n=1 Tax=Flagellimonas zhangzhouensis TaxID=1073328 RepID=A0A1H2SXG1_9FLAO|nr:alpha/beta hydrolase [Allomuricauda zhangzhouensis]SDQ81005.1 Pimeloyl-ACP methyl ester carboxylesterase [Allomuricauda zhangzhouensis]SDW36396.1 Pimeloyl-ACP methyl ester carboxylesterase [Allomuricauda zhangzhouensis]
MKTNLISVIIIGMMLFSSYSCKNKREAKPEKVVEVESPKLKSIEVNDYTINYLDIGKGEPVVFVHGGVGDYRTWEAQTEVFSEDYRVIAISRRYAHPNKQEANETNDYSVTQHSNDLTQFLKALNLGPVHLVGHSYGAFTSLMAALENPELVKSLTLGEPPVVSFLQYTSDGETIGNDFIMNVVMPSAQAFNSNNDKKAVELFIGSILTDSLHFSKATEKEKKLMMDNAFELKGILLTENPYPPLVCEDLNKLNKPTLLIKGDRSPKVLTVITDELSKCIVNSEVKELSNASHGLEYQNPNEFNKIVLEFIGKH